MTTTKPIPVNGSSPVGNGVESFPLGGDEIKKHREAVISRQNLLSGTEKITPRHETAQRLPNVFQKWFAKLHGLGRLKEGWDSYDAPVPGTEAIAAAELYLSVAELVVWEPSRVEASVMGGVGITHRAGKRKVYIEFYNNGKGHALFSDGHLNMETLAIVSDAQSYYRFIGKAREYLND